MEFLFNIDYDEVIEVNSSSILLIKSSTHTILGSVIEIRQIFKVKSRIIDGGVTIVPESTVGLSIVDSIRTYLHKKLKTNTPHDRLKSWLGELDEAFVRARDASIPSGLPFLKEGRESEKVPLDRLKEPIPNTTFTLEDLVYAIQHGKPFSKQIKVPLNQMKVVLYYGFLGKPQMITMDVEKTLLQHNLTFDYKRCGMLLKQLADDNLIEMEERTSKIGRKYYLWKFPAVNEIQTRGKKQ